MVVADKLEIIPLGGVGEIGKNMIALRCRDSILVLDAGLMFPDEQMLGVDLVIPDISWLVENSGQVLGICLTHGHEDHIGALPYVLKDLNVPVWGTKLTLGFVSPKLDEHQIENPQLNEVSAGDRIQIGPFEVEFIRVSHSIPDACSLAIHTPVGLLVHTSDFKFDTTPVDGRHTDIARFAELGREGVLALTTDSTNVEKPGYSLSESVLWKTFDDIIGKVQGRVIVACFASNIHRIQQIADVSIKHNRQIAVVGRSMEQNVETARSLGYLQIPDWALVDISQIAQCDPEQITIVTTGSQGEPLSVLTRISMDDHRRVKVEEGDTVIISAKPIPGNESLVQRVINNLFKRGAKVIYNEIEPVHVSGHANKEELRMMLSLVRPRFIIPVHGEYRHLANYAEMAGESGYSSANIIRIEVGDILEITPESARITGKLDQPGSVMVDGLGVGDVGDIALRDRWHLANDGVLVVVVSIDSSTGQIVSGPDLMSRGLMDEEEDFLAEARDFVLERIEGMPPDAAGDASIAQRDIRDALAKFVNSRTRRRPVIIPIVMEM